MVALSQLVLLITTKVVGGNKLSALGGGVAGLGGAATLAAGALAALTAAALAFGAISLSKYFEFSIQMGLVSSATAATTEEIVILEEEALRLGRTLGTFSATEAATSMKLLAFAGFEVQEILDSTETIMRFAIATQIDLSMATDIAARALRTFKIEAVDVERVTDTLTMAFTSSATTVEELGTALSYVGPIASAAGYSLEETSAAIMVLANVGIRGSMAGTQLRQVIMRLQAPTSGAARVLADLGVELYELTPAALSTQRSLANSSRELRELEAEMKRTSAATRELDMNLRQLNIEESKNRLEIMKIRDKAADENRDLTASELSMIDQLERANEDLAISQLETSIKRDELSLATEQQKIKEEELNVTLEEQTELFNSQKGAMVELTEVAAQFSSAMEGMSASQQAAALNTIFGLRAISGFQTILENTESLENYTNLLNESAGATAEQSAIVEEAAGISWKEFTSGMETFMTEVGKALAPMIIQITDSILEMKSAFDAVAMVVGGQVMGAMVVLGPMLDILVWTVKEFDEELILLGKVLGVVAFGAAVFMTAINPFTPVLLLVAGAFALVGLAVRAVSTYLADDLAPVVEMFTEVFMGLEEFLKGGMLIALEMITFAFEFLEYSVGHLSESIQKFNDYTRELHPVIDTLTRIVSENINIFEILGAILLVLVLAPIVAVISVVAVLVAVFVGLVLVVASVIEIIALLYDGFLKLRELRDTFKDWGIETLVDGLTSIGQELDKITGFTDKLKEIMSILSGIGDAVSGAGGNIGGVISSIIPGAAKGGVFTTPQLIQVAEERPEIVTPIDQMGGGTGTGNNIVTNDTYTINVYPSEGTNGETLLEELRQAIETERINKRGSIFNTVG